MTKHAEQRHAEQKHAEQKNNRKAKLLVVLTILVLLVGVMGFAIYQFVSESIQLQKEQEKFGDLRDLIGEDVYDDGSGGTLTRSKYDALFAMNSDMQGWLRINGTAIDYPVMKNDLENGEYYLHRDFDEEYSFAGCLFIGPNCDVNSDIFIIYGHNMKNGSMFACLTDFADAGFANRHMEISFDTKDERRVYRVFAAFAANVYPDGEEYDEYFKYYRAIGKLSGEEYQDVLGQYRAMADLWTGDVPQYPDQIMLMSTCFGDRERYVVAAYRIK